MANNQAVINFLQEQLATATEQETIDGLTASIAQLNQLEADLAAAAHAAQGQQAPAALVQAPAAQPQPAQDPTLTTLVQAVNTLAQHAAANAQQQPQQNNWWDTKEIVLLLPDPRDNSFQREAFFRAFEEEKIRLKNCPEFLKAKAIKQWAITAGLPFNTYFSLAAMQEPTAVANIEKWLKERFPEKKQESRNKIYQEWDGFSRTSSKKQDYVDSFDRMLTELDKVGGKPAELTLPDVFLAKAKLTVEQTQIMEARIEMKETVTGKTRDLALVVSEFLLLPDSTFGLGQLPNLAINWVDKGKGKGKYSTKGGYGRYDYRPSSRSRSQYSPYDAGPSGGKKGGSWGKKGGQKGRDRGKSRGKSRGDDRDRGRPWSRTPSFGRSPSRGKGKSQGSRSRSPFGGKGKGKGKSKGKSRSPSRGRFPNP